MRKLVGQITQDDIDKGQSVTPKFRASSCPTFRSVQRILPDVDMVSSIGLYLKNGQFIKFPENVTNFVNHADYQFHKKRHKEDPPWSLSAEKKVEYETPLLPITYVLTILEDEDYAKETTPF